MAGAGAIDGVAHSLVKVAGSGPGTTKASKTALLAAIESGQVASISALVTSADTVDFETQVCACLCFSKAKPALPPAFIIT